MAGLIDTNTGLGDGAALSQEPALSYSPSLWDGGSVPGDNRLLLVNLSSFLLLADNSSELLLAGN